MEPATNWFDESFAPFLKSHERFARQQRSRTSITHSATSSNSRKDHQLSSIKNIILLYEHTPAKPFIRWSYYFHSDNKFHLAYLTIFSNSLIRVSRRVKNIAIKLNQCWSYEPTNTILILNSSECPCSLTRRTFKTELI